MARTAMEAGFLRKEVPRRRWGRAQSSGVIDPYQLGMKLAEPTACPQCGAVYHQGRWTWAARPEGSAEATCPACRRVAEKYPAGTLALSGSFVRLHREALLHLAHAQEGAERPEHPMNRIMGIVEEAPDRVVITTTDIHLPRRIVDAIKRAYRGTLTERFDESEYVVQITWHRDA